MMVLHMKGEASVFFGLGKSCSIVWKGLDLRIVGHSFVTYNLLFIRFFP